jgi:hypothetical protein
MRGWFLTLVLALVGVGQGVGQMSGSEVMSRFAGRWVFAGDVAERQARIDAIEATVSQMSWIARGTARKRITTSTPIHQQYLFEVDGSTVTIGEDDFEGFSTPWDGTPVEISRNRGGPATLTRSVDQGGLRAHWQQKKGAGTEIYRVAADGVTMTVEVVISSPRLPSDVRYELSYRKAPSVPQPGR